MARAAIRTSKNTVMLAGGTVIRMVASFAFALYCAALLGVEGFGKYSIAIFYFELFLSLAATAIGILLTRDLAKRPEDVDKLLSSASTVGLALCCIPPFIVVPIGIGLNYSSETVQAMGVACVALVPASLALILEAAFVTKERAEYVTAGATIESFIRIGLSFAALTAGMGLVTLVWILALARSALLVYYIISFRKMVPFRWRTSFADVRAFAKRWRTFAAENWMATIYTNLDVLLLSYFSGELAVGLYSAAWKLVRLGSVLAKSYTTAIFPVMSRLYGSSRDQFHLLCRQSIRAMAILAVPAACVVGVLSDRFIALLFTEEYAPASMILRVMIWVLLAEFLNPFLSHSLFAQGKQRKSMNVAAVSLIFNLIASIMLIRRYGATGAAAGTVFSGLVATGCYLAYLLPAKQIGLLFLSLARIGVTAAGLGLISHWLQDASWLAIIAANVAAFVPLLLISGAAKFQDVEFVRSIFKQRNRDTAMDEKNIRVGVVGCGAIAECYHLPALVANPKTRNGIALADLNIERARATAEKFNASAVVGDFKELEGLVDAVIVATPPASHHAIAKWFLERGIHVLCEKPLTESYVEAQDLVSTGLANDAFLFVNQTRRFFPAYQKIRQLIADGVLGDLISIEYQDGIEFSWPAASPHHFRPDARGAWSDTGVHLLDTVIYWLDGEPELVASQNDSDGGPEALATVRLRHHACEITIKVSRLGRLTNGFKIVGTRGFIESDAENWSNVTVHFAGGRKKRYSCNAEAYQQYSDFAAPLIRNLVSSINGQDVPTVSGQSTLSTIRLLEEAYDKASHYPMPWNSKWKELTSVS